MDVTCWATCSGNASFTPHVTKLLSNGIDCTMWECASALISDQISPEYLQTSKDHKDFHKCYVLALDHFAWVLA